MIIRTADGDVVVVNGWDRWFDRSAAPDGAAWKPAPKRGDKRPRVPLVPEAGIYAPKVAEEQPAYSRLDLAFGRHLGGGRGRPPTRIEAKLLAAFMHDVEGRTAKDVGNEVGVGRADVKWDNSAVYEGYITAGRKEAHRRGAWPWALVSDGEVPGDWRRRDEFRVALRRWKRA